MSRASHVTHADNYIYIRVPGLRPSHIGYTKSFLLHASIGLALTTTPRCCTHLSACAWAALTLVPVVSAAAECPLLLPEPADSTASGSPPSSTSTFGRCSQLSNQAGGGTRSSDWWLLPAAVGCPAPILARAESRGDFDYVAAFNSLDCMYPAMSTLPWTWHAEDRIQDRSLTLTS